ncbi:hypothetical protein CS542_02180 [Pedobacter sp. IW39]|nr:hypothetical protein CS542_02180 [Pedobacter sp. IW39]
MILPAIGEEFDGRNYLCFHLIFNLFASFDYYWKANGTPFLFYICGNRHLYFHPVLLIAGGSIGALPLSGVSLLESYGGSSLVINLVAAGFYCRPLR